jgi:hypothetical protein
MKAAKNGKMGLVAGRVCQARPMSLLLHPRAQRASDGTPEAESVLRRYELHVRHQQTEVRSPPRETSDHRTAPHWWNGRIERTRLPEDATKPPAENAK